MITPIWVDLLTVNPVLEDYEEELLEMVGKVIYVAPKYADNKYSNIRGCVKVDLSKPLDNLVITKVKGIGIFKIDIDF